MRECLNYVKSENSVIQCRTCSHFCNIPAETTGICGIRQNAKGKLFLLSYGKAIASHIDPVEKKPLFHFLPGSLAYSVGTIGCNFRCGNCQNFDISQMFGYKGKVEKYDILDWGEELPPQTIVENAAHHGCKSIAYTYNEPTVWLEYALDTMKLAKKRGLKNIWVSNGYMSNETLDLIVPYLDAVNIDIKSFDDEFYASNCGARLAPVLENCERLVRDRVWLEVTTLIIPTLSDNFVMLEKIATFINNKLGDFVPWHVSAFSGTISWKLQHMPDTKTETIRKVYDIGKQAGLKHVYAGNVWDERMESTHCHGCNTVLIKRSGYEIKRNDKNGRCKCGEKIHGIF